MGDRANFGVKQGEDFIYLYGHWAGQGMMRRLATALKRVSDANRLNDEVYATRILFSALVYNDWENDFGWGISVNSITDNEHKIPVVDFREGTVTLHWDAPDASGLGKAIFTTTIPRFIARYS